MLAGTISPEVDEAVRLLARGVHVRVGGRRILAGVDLSLSSGELVLLRGDNGSGKTTLLNVISGFVAPSVGDVRFRGPSGWLDATRCGPEVLARNGLGRLWQDVRIFPSLTAWDNVLVALSPVPLPWGFDSRPDRSSAREFLAVVGMADKASHLCAELSLGEIKRVALARLLARGASVLLLDEPLAGLDSGASADFLQALTRVRSVSDTAVLIIEHRGRGLASMATRSLTLVDGQVSEEGRRVRALAV